MQTRRSVAHFILGLVFPRVSSSGFPEFHASNLNKMIQRRPLLEALFAYHTYALLSQRRSQVCPQSHEDQWTFDQSQSTQLGQRHSLRLQTRRLAAHFSCYSVSYSSQTRASCQAGGNSLGKAPFSRSDLRKRGVTFCQDFSRLYQFFQGD